MGRDPLLGGTGATADLHLWPGSLSAEIEGVKGWSAQLPREQHILAKATIIPKTMGQLALARLPSDIEACASVHLHDAGYAIAGPHELRYVQVQRTPSAGVLQIPLPVDQGDKVAGPVMVIGFASMYPSLLRRGRRTFGGDQFPLVPAVETLLACRTEAGDGTPGALVYKLLGNALIGWLKSIWPAVGYVGFFYTDSVVKLSQDLLSHTVKAVGIIPRTHVLGGVTDSVFVAHRRGPDEPQAADADTPWMITCDQRDQSMEEAETS